MGRKPNQLILRYFERGPKLTDNSNRYPHRCKACGEDFPKGRIDSLTNHLTKKCPAISEAERINACLLLHGINASSPRRPQNAGSQSNGSGSVAAAATTTGHPPPLNSWTDLTALETLAEVSRRKYLSEKHDDHMPNPQNATHEAYHHPLAALEAETYELQEHFTLENPPLNDENRPHQEQVQDQDMSQDASVAQEHEMTTEERIRTMLGDNSALDVSNLSVAAAATARLNTSFLDPQLQLQVLAQHAQHVTSEPGIERAVDAAVSYATSAPSAAASIGIDTAVSTDSATMALSAPAPTDEMVVDWVSPPRASTPMGNTPGTTHESVSPWGEMSQIAYIPDNIQPPAKVSDQSQQLAYTLNKGGNRMDTFSPNGTRNRHARARFDSERRKEVQEVRRIGACIRCRILRKNCSKGTPCDTCRKVLSPRVWLTGCTRTKLAEQIELYSAGVQIVVAQKRVNKVKTDYNLSSSGIVFEASHFHETGKHITLQVLQGSPSANTENSSSGSDASSGQTVMIDNDKEDIPAQVENYMRQMLPELISRESSSHVRVTLECAVKVAQDTNDELLRRALELWGLAEIMDRERQWSFLKKSSDGNDENIWLKDDLSNDNHDNETFTSFCMQLTAGAERKAAATSKTLLNGIQRNLQDGKTKLGFPMFLTAMIFLNCVEKTTWAFKAWEGEALQPLWPLEKQPSNYYNQGHGLCELLKMLLHIRHILPKVSAPDPDLRIVADEEDETIKKYYQDLNVTRKLYIPADSLHWRFLLTAPFLANFLRSRREQFSFDQSDSRSLEFLFCSALLQP
jgi:hypothetical protein